MATRGHSVPSVLRAVGLALVLPALLASGCALGPNYQRPAVPTPPAWRDIPASEAASLANTSWWDVFQDPALQELIRIALAENRDLKIAAERIEEARARYGFTKADFFPQLDLSGQAARLKQSEKGLIPIPNREDKPLYTLEGQVSWEIDVFGRIRRATEAQRAQLLATEEARRAVVLSLVADVARAYVELRDFDLRLEISRRTLESRREYVQLAKDRFEGGLTAELDMRQAEAEYYRTQALVFQFEVAVALKENELAVLLGRNPGPLPRQGEIPEFRADVPAGLPSALLERRPDIRQAEEILHATTADIGQAKALLFPRIALTGGYGWESTAFGDLFSKPAASWSIAGNLLQPIFNAGKNKQRVRIAESVQRQTLFAYEQTILLAFREVEDSLVTHRKAGEQRGAQGERVKAERKVLELAELRYRGGVSAYLEVLDAQRSLFGAELDERQSVRDHLVSLIQLYKALGGGWPPAPESTAGTTSTPPGTR